MPTDEVTQTETLSPRQAVEELKLTRRRVLQGAGAVTTAFVIGCSGTAGTGDEDAGTGQEDGGAQDAGESDAGTDGGTGNQAPVWSVIPDQTWVVGVPVLLDLAAYCTDPDGDALSFSLDLALPPGVTLSGSVISGTPTAEFAQATFVATAADGA